MQIQGFESKRFVDLFSGIGGFHLAMSEFGANCVFASEWDIFAAKVYEQNFKIKPFGDITKISEKDIPEHDVLCAGFPCQAFSVSGKQKGFEDTRGTLFFDIVRIVKHHKPEILLLENVKNLESHDNGKTLKIILNALDELEYKVFYKILNASDFGLPQNRERIYFVCFRKDLNIKHFVFPAPLDLKTSLKSVLEVNSKIKPMERNDVTLKNDIQPCINLFGELDLPNKPIQIGIVNKGGQGERIYSTLGHACTLSAYGGGVGAKTGLYLVDEKIRKLSPRECARIQGFPDSFKLDSNSNQAYKQFGNSVPVNVLREITKKVIKAINQ